MAKYGGKKGGGKSSSKPKSGYGGKRDASLPTKTVPNVTGGDKNQVKRGKK